MTQLTFRFYLDPFSIATDFGTYFIPSTPHPANVPFDFLISCEAETFKLYVDGVIVANSLSNFHSTRNGLNIVMPQVTYIAVYQNNMAVTKASWNYGTDSGCNSQCQWPKSYLKISVAPNGVLGTMVGMLTIPWINVFWFSGLVALPDFSTILYIYQNTNKTETRYLPAQAVQNCFRWDNLLIYLNII